MLNLKYLIENKKELEKVIETISEDNPLKQAVKIFIETIKTVSENSKVNITYRSAQAASEIVSHSVEQIEPKQYTSDSIAVSKQGQQQLATERNKKLLARLGISENSKLGQAIIGLLENGRIVLGIFFPGVRDKFISEHKTDVSEELNELIGSVGALKYAAEHVPTNRIAKFAMALSVLLNPVARVQLAKAHAEWNKNKRTEQTREMSDIEQENFQHGYFFARTGLVNAVDIKEEKDDDGSWAQKLSGDERHYAFKIHLYSDGEEDWEQMVETLMPFLEYARFSWKTVSRSMTISRLNAGTQKGKAFTLYPRNEAEFRSIVAELDNLFRDSNLVRKDSYIQGDRALGTSGRIFYRYEFGDKKYLGEKYNYGVLDLSKKEEKSLYYSSYEANRLGDRYLAKDMIPERDDPFYNWNPQEELDYIVKAVTEEIKKYNKDFVVGRQDILTFIFTKTEYVANMKKEQFAKKVADMMIEMYRTLGMSRKELSDLMEEVREELKKISEEKIEFSEFDLINYISNMTIAVEREESVNIKPAKEFAESLAEVYNLQKEKKSFLVERDITYNDVRRSLSDSQERERIIRDLGTDQYEIFYLEDFNSASEKERMLNAVLEGKYFVIYPYRKGAMPKNARELYNIYKNLNLYAFLENLFPESMYSYDSVYRYKDKDGKQRFGIRYLIKEILKNAFVHGNNLNITQPIYLKLSIDENSLLTAEIINRISEESPISELEYNLSKGAGLHGAHLGAKQADLDSEYGEYQEDGLFKVVIKDIHWLRFDDVKAFIDGRPQEDFNKTEESLNVKTTAKTDVSDSVKAVKETYSPIKALQKFAVKIITGMNTETAMVDGKQESLVIAENAEEARSLREQGLRAVSVRENFENEYGGEVIMKNYKGTGKDVRVKINKDGEIIFCIKTRMEMTEEIKEELLQKLAEEIAFGREMKGFENISQAVRAKDGEALKEVKNEITNSITNPINLRYDLSEEKDGKGREISEKVCRGIEAECGAKVFVITQNQAERYAKEIEAMEGVYTFIAAESSVGNFERELKNNTSEEDSDFILDMTKETKTLEELKGIFESTRQAKQTSKSGVSATVLVKINSETAENIGEINIYEEYGIIPMISAKDVAKVRGKKEVYNLADEEEMEKIKGNDITGFVVDEKMLSKVRAKKGGIREMLEGLMAEDTPERMYKKGANAARSSKFEYSAKAENITNIINSGILSADLRDVETKAKEINKNWFSPDTQTYLEYLEKKGKYEEILGFVRGVVLRTVAKEICGLETISIDTDKFMADIMSNEVQAILIMTVQQLANMEMKDKTIKEVLEELFRQTAGSDVMTAEEYLNSIRINLNGAMDEVLRKNETKIDTSVAALTPFDGIPELLMDSYRPRNSVGKDINISIMAVKSMLSAA